MTLQSKNFMPLLALVLSVATALAPVNVDAAPTRQSSGAQAKSPARSCFTGLGYVTAERKLAPDAAYDLIAQAADIAYIQRTWDEWLNKPDVCAKEIALARARKLKIYIAFDALSYEDLRAQIVLPKGLKGDFNTPALRTAYLDLMQRMAKDFKPDYFVPMVEIDLHKRKNPRDYAAYKQLYPLAYKMIKAASPNSMVAPSITYGDYDGKNAIDESDKREFASVVNDFSQHTDMLAVSTYPLCFLTPQAIPTEIFPDMAAATTQPLFISETSWPSDTFEIPMGSTRFKFNTSQASQAAYVEKLRQSAGQLTKSGRRIIAVNFVSLADPNSVAKFLANLVQHQFNWFASLSLTDNDGKPKAAFLSLKYWRNLPMESGSP
jgi:hypothetical protein